MSNLSRQVLKIINFNVDDIYEHLESECYYEYFILDLSNVTFEIYNEYELQKFMKIIDMYPKLQFIKFKIEVSSVDLANKLVKHAYKQKIFNDFDLFCKNFDPKI